MPTMTRIDPPLPLLTPHGPGYAHFVIDYSQEHHLVWVVFLDASGECWAVENPHVRLAANPTMGRAGAQAPKTEGPSQ